MYFTFSHPVYLIFLFIIPAFIFVHFLTLKFSRREALKFANFDAIARVKGIDIFSRNLFMLILGIILCSLLIFSLSGLTAHMVAKASESSFVIAVDSSSSMGATDISPNRLDSAKQAAGNFIQSSPETTRIGIISFSGNSFILQDITSNKEELRAAVSEIQEQTIEGTDVPEAIVNSVNLLREEKTKSIILLSDGQINTGDIDSAISYANKNNVIINTIAVGTMEGGNTSYGVSTVDEEALKAIAYNTGGIFSNASSSQEMGGAFSGILKISNQKVAIDTSNYLLIASIILFFIYYFLASTRFRLYP